MLIAVLCCAFSWGRGVEKIIHTLYIEISLDCQITSHAGNYYNHLHNKRRITLQISDSCSAQFIINWL